MKVIGSIIARLGSKRLPYKNLLPFAGQSMICLGIEKLRAAALVDEIVVSTESELIARTVYPLGVRILRRPAELAADDVPSVPVFLHLIEHFPCSVHVNLNINFPMCDPSVVDRAVDLAASNARGEALSVPYAVWAQTADCLKNYGDPWKLKAEKFNDPRAGGIDVHTEEELLEAHRRVQGAIPGW